MSAARLGLGTVQFAFDYGATNERGRVATEEARRILRMAAAGGMSVIHTSSTYGDSEALLGGEADTVAPLRIALKLPPIRAPRIDASERAALAQSLAQTRARLKRNRIEFVLFHHARELCLPGSQHALDLLREAKARGEIGRLGVTAYDPADVTAALDFFQPEIVQVPLNLFDQRFAKSGVLAALMAAGTEIHVRSVFLQGTLLVEPDQLPAMLHWARPAFMEVEQFIAAHRLTRLEACLGYALSVREVDNIVLGVTSTDELREILAAVNGLPAALPDFARLANEDERLINPNQWINRYQEPADAGAFAPPLPR